MQTSLLKMRVKNGLCRYREFCFSKIRIVKITLRLLSRSMIVVKFSGDLGAQLFQWATALKLIDRKSALKLGADYSEFNLYKKNIPSLKEIGINISEPSDLYYIKKMSTCWSRSFKIISFGRWPKRISEGSHGPVSFSSSQNILLDGYWRDPQFFADIKSSLSAEIKLPELPQELVALLSQLKSKPVLICSDQAWVQWADLESWRSRADKIVERESQITVVHLRSQTNLLYPQGVDLSKYSQGVQLHFISKLDFIFLTPSLIAWWGAWLSGAEGHKVYFPKDWNRLTGKASGYYIPSWKEY